VTSWWIYFRHCTRLLTAGNRPFPVAAARVWNQLPCHVCTVSARFLQSSEGLSFQLFFFPPFCGACEVTRVIIGHFNRCCCLRTFLTDLRNWTCWFGCAVGMSASLSALFITRCRDGWRLLCRWSGQQDLTTRSLPLRPSTVPTLTQLTEYVVRPLCRFARF